MPATRSCFGVAVLLLFASSANGNRSTPAQADQVPLQAFEAVEAHMGTLFRIKLYARDEQQAESAFHAAFERVAAVDSTLSDYKPNSELSRLSVTAVQHSVKVGDDLFYVLSASQQLSQETDGAFDITVGPLTRLWREARRQRRVPDPADVQQALSRCGFHKLHVNAADHTVKLDTHGMQLDAGGIAKGYAVDEALSVLKRNGISSALVAASGDLAFSDAPPGQRGWKIGIDSYDFANAPFTRIVQLENGAVSTSGDTEQHLDAGGVRYSHIINPKTGMGLTWPLTVTVVAKRGIDADALATAVSVLGLREGRALIESKPDVAAVMVDREPGKADIQETSRWRAITGGN
jgi:FAD:protein FMN transferase